MLGNCSNDRRRTSIIRAEKGFLKNFVFISKLPKKIIVYTDGGSRSNPGPAGIGVVVKDDKEKTLEKYSAGLGIRTNNEAEYEAVILALTKIKEMFESEIKNIKLEVRMDSQLIARQLGGKYKIKEERLRALAEKAWKIMAEFGSVSFTEVRREKNSEADELANEAMDRQETKSS